MSKVQEDYADFLFKENETLRGKIALLKKKKEILHKALEFYAEMNYEVYDCDTGKEIDWTRHSSKAFCDDGTTARQALEESEVAG